MTASSRRPVAAAVLGLVLGLAAVPLASAGSSQDYAPAGPGFQVRNLVSDDVRANPARHQDAHLVNAWGLAFGAALPVRPLDSLLIDWVCALREFSVDAVVVLGPDPFGRREDRVVAAAYPPRFLTAAEALAEQGLADVA